MHGEMLLCVIDVDIFMLCGFGVWMSPYLALRRRTLIHCRVPNPAKHTKVEYKVPPRCLGLSQLPVHANYPCILWPPPSEPDTPNGDPTTHCQTPNTLPHDFPPSVCELGHCHRVCLWKPRNTNFPSNQYNSFPT